MKNKLEICVDSIDSALNAQKAGADRIELCDNLIEGGTTPSLGMITTVRNKLSIDVNVIIRPRGGDFLYSDDEFLVMKKDIEICRDNGIDGVVTGILRKNGMVDTERTGELVRLAGPMQVTFHRAFDMCPDPVKGLEDIINTRSNRILTSGHKNNAVDGLELIAQLVKLAGNRIIIMPGGGLNINNIKEVIFKSKANEFHLTGRSLTDSKMEYRRDDIFMGGYPEVKEYSRKVADISIIEKIAVIIKQQE